MKAIAPRKLSARRKLGEKGRVAGRAIVPSEKGVCCESERAEELSAKKGEREGNL